MVHWMTILLLIVNLSPGLQVHASTSASDIQVAMFPLSFGGTEVASQISQVAGIEWMSDLQEVFILGQTVDQYAIFGDASSQFVNADSDQNSAKKSTFLARMNMHTLDDLRAIAFALKSIAQSGSYERLDPLMLKVGPMEDELGESKDYLGLAFKSTNSQQLLALTDQNIIKNLDAEKVEITTTAWYTRSTSIEIQSIHFFKKRYQVVIHLKDNCGHDFCSQYFTTYDMQSQTFSTAHEYRQPTHDDQLYEHPLFFIDTADGKRYNIISAVYRLQKDQSSNSYTYQSRGIRATIRGVQKWAQFTSNPTFHYYIQDGLTPQREKGICFDRQGLWNTLVFFSETNHFPFNNGYVFQELHLNLWIWKNTINNPKFQQYQSLSEAFNMQRRILDFYVEETNDGAVQIFMITKQVNNGQMFLEKIDAQSPNSNPSVTQIQNEYTSLDNSFSIYKMISNNDENIIMVGSKQYAQSYFADQDTFNQVYGTQASVGIILATVGQQKQAGTQQNMNKLSAYRPDETYSYAEDTAYDSQYTFCNVRSLNSSQNPSDFPWNTDSLPQIDVILVRSAQLSNLFYKSSNLDSKITSSSCQANTITTTDANFSDSSSVFQISRETISGAQVSFTFSMEKFNLETVDYMCSDIEAKVQPWYNTSADESNKLFYELKNDTVQQYVQTNYANGIETKDLVDIQSQDKTSDSDPSAKYKEYTISVKSTNEIANLIGLFYLKLTVKQQSSSNAGLNWMVVANISEVIVEQPIVEVVDETVEEEQVQDITCTVNSLVLDTFKGPFSTIPESSKNPYYYKYEVAAGSTLTINYEAQVKQVPDCGEKLSFQKLILKSSDNSKATPGSEYLPVIFNFNQFSRSFTLLLPSNLTEASEWKGNYKFELSQSLKSNKDISILILQFGLQILEPQNLIDEQNEGNQTLNSTEIIEVESKEEQEDESSNDNISNTESTNEFGQFLLDRQQSASKANGNTNQQSNVNQLGKITEEEKEKLKPVKIKINEMTREGKIIITFNQNLKIPSFFQGQNAQQTTEITNLEGNNNSQRLLNAQIQNKEYQQEISTRNSLRLRELNRCIKRQECTNKELKHLSEYQISSKSRNLQSEILFEDIFTIKIDTPYNILNNEIDESRQIALQPQILEWTKKFIQIQLNIDKPLQLSRTASGQPQDIVQVLIKDTSYFVSQENNLELLIDNVKLGLQIIVPKQLPNGVSETEILQKTNSQEKTLQIIIIIAALFMKAGSQRLINLVMAVQIISYLPLYKVDFPAELELYIKALRKIAEFDILPTQEIKNWLSDQELISFGSNMTAEQAVAEQTYSSAGFKSFNPLENLFGFLLILTIITIVIALFSLLALIKKIREKIKNKLIDIKNSFFWSGFLKSIILTYLKNFVSFYLAMQLIIDSKDQVQVNTIITTAITGMPLVLFPIWSVVFLLINKDKLQNEDFQKKFSGLYSDLKQNYNIHSASVLLFPSIFAIRRVSYVFTAMINFKVIYGNIAFLIILSFAYFAWLEHVRPFQSHRQLQIETINELLLLLLCYHMLCFTDLTTIDMQVQRIQTSFLSIVGTLVCVNLFTLFMDTIKCQSLKRFIEKKMIKRKAQRDSDKFKLQNQESSKSEEQDDEQEILNVTGQITNENISVQYDQDRLEEVTDYIGPNFLKQQHQEDEISKEYQKQIQKEKEVMQMTAYQRYLGLVEKNLDGGESGDLYNKFQQYVEIRKWQQQEQRKKNKKKTKEEISQNQIKRFQRSKRSSISHKQLANQQTTTQQSEEMTLIKLQTIQEVEEEQNINTIDQDVHTFRL